MSASTYGVRLRAVLKILRRTQTDLADAVGVSQTAVSKWMRGASLPETSQLVATAEYLNVSLDYLVRSDDEVCEESIHLRRRIDDAVVMLGLVESYRRLMMVGGPVVGGVGGGLGGHSIGRVLALDEAAEHVDRPAHGRPDRDKQRAKPRGRP